MLSTSLQATYTFSLPYVYTVQTEGLFFPVHLWHDSESQRLRMDVYDGLDSTITVKVGVFTCRFGLQQTATCQ